MTKKNNTMFLRFYDVSDERIEECITKLKELYPITSYTKGPLTLSVNFGGYDNGVEVDLVFPDAKIRNAFYEDSVTKDIYLEYSTKYDKNDVKLEVRKPGDKSYKV